MLMPKRTRDGAQCWRWARLHYVAAGFSAVFNNNVTTAIRPQGIYSGRVVAVNRV